MGRTPTLRYSCTGAERKCSPDTLSSGTHRSWTLLHVQCTFSFVDAPDSCGTTLWAASLVPKERDVAPVVAALLGAAPSNPDRNRRTACASRSPPSWTSSDCSNVMTL